MNTLRFFKLIQLGIIVLTLITYFSTAGNALAATPPACPSDLESYAYITHASTASDCPPVAVCYADSKIIGLISNGVDCYAKYCAGTSCTGGAGIACGNQGVETALGCISYLPEDLIGSLITYIEGFAGGVALLMMIIGAFQMITSSGNPDAIRAGRERFTAAIIGLIFIIFSVVLLKIIGVDILQIPGFTAS